MFTLSLPVLLPTAFYTLAITATFFSKNIKLWGSLIAIGLSSALYFQHISLVSLPYLAAVFIISYGLFNAKSKALKSIFLVLFIFIGFVTLLNKIPGIHNILILNNYNFSEDAIPFSLYFSLDSSLIGLAVMAFGIQTICSKESLLRIGRVFTLLIPIMLCSVIVASKLLGYIKWNLKLLTIFSIWALCNLLLTCVTEEAIFRGVFQDTLQNVFKNFRWGNYLGIIIAALLFGLAHFAGGPLYILLASLAGLFYGLAYHLTGRIEASIAAHFILNTVHFIFFTYPALATSIPL